MEKQDLENQSSTKLDELEKKTKTSFKITLSQISRKREEGKLAREERFLDTINLIKRIIMWSLIILVIFFCTLTIIAGIGIWKNDNEGWKALESLFVTIVNNAKPIIYVVLGFFFRDYIQEIANKRDD